MKVELRKEIIHKSEVIYLICSHNEPFSNSAIALNDPINEIPKIIKVLKEYQKNIKKEN